MAQKCDIGCTRAFVRAAPIFFALQALHSGRFALFCRKQGAFMWVYVAVSRSEFYVFLRGSLYPLQPTSLRDPLHPPSLLERRPLTWCLELGAKSNLSFAISRAKGFFSRILEFTGDFCLGIKTTGRDASAEHMLSRLEGTLDLVGSSDHREGQILISDSHLHDAVHQPPPVPPLGSVHRTGIGRGRRRRSSPGSRPLAPRSLPLRSTSRGSGAVRDGGGARSVRVCSSRFDDIPR